MNPADGPRGWAWLGGTASVEEPDPELVAAFAACFAGQAGRRALDHLRDAIVERRCPPDASDAELRHLEGQRAAVAYVRALVARGRRLAERRDGPSPLSPSTEDAR